jgi:Glycosyl transferases group 1
MNKKRLNIIYKTQIAQITGLERDALILQDVLKSFYNINHYQVTERRKLRQLGLPQYLPSKLTAYFKTLTRKFDANIFLEKIRPELLHLADINILIPNHEMFSKKSVPLLSHIDLVLCKTLHAYDIFSGLNVRSEFIGFTSVDRSIPGSQPDYSKFFHLAGKSAVRRGTHQILEIWKKNPHFPRLTVIAHDLDSNQYHDYDNICVYGKYVDEKTTKQLQNQIGVHICLSEAEGFGHFIMEAMGAHACVVTTNAPPMNEAVSIERGYLVNVANEEILDNCFSKRYLFCSKDLLKVIESLIASPTPEKEARGSLSREYYEKSTELFRSKLIQSLGNILNNLTK